MYCGEPLAGISELHLHWGAVSLTAVSHAIPSPTLYSMQAQSEASTLQLRHIDGLVQERCNSIALGLSCTRPSECQSKQAVKGMGHI